MRLDWVVDSSEFSQTVARTCMVGDEATMIDLSWASNWCDWSLTHLLFSVGDWKSCILYSGLWLGLMVGLWLVNWSGVPALYVVVFSKGYREQARKLLICSFKRSIVQFKETPSSHSNSLCLKTYFPSFKRKNEEN